MTLITNLREIKHLLANSYLADRASINPDRSIDVIESPVYLFKTRLLDYLPNGVKIKVKFNLVSNFYASRLGADSEKLISLEGCPKIVTGICNLSDNKISSLDFLPETTEVLILNNNPLTSLAGLHTKLYSCYQLYLPASINSSILGLLKIQNLQSVIMDLSRQSGEGEFGKAMLLELSP
jgi:hypothetical protein